MKTATRKITSLTFLLLGFAPLLFVLVITLKKQEIRIRMEEEMEARELQSIVIPVNEVVWMDKHEIWVNNQMFDIHTRELRDGSYHFTGLYDAEETELVEKEKENGNRKQAQHQLLVKLFKSIPAFHNNAADTPQQAARDADKPVFTPAKPPRPCFDILTPPPRMAGIHAC